MTAAGTTSSPLFSDDWRRAHRTWRRHYKLCVVCSAAVARRDLCVEGARLFHAMVMTP